MPGGNGLLDDRRPDEPGAPQHQHTHPPIIPSTADHPSTTPTAFARLPTGTIDP
jgi:hypothetical protein